MTTKILIIGFQHSGTTMLRQLINNHPQVSIIYDEHRYIELPQSKEWIMSLISKEVYPNGKKMSWGEKIPWVDGDSGRIISLSKRWFKFFGKDSRIIHILRHPLDVALSISPDYERSLKLILKSDPKVIDFVNSDKRSSTILYEDLVNNPLEKLISIFSFCNLNSTEKVVKKVMNFEGLKFGGINSDRAFAYKKKGYKEIVDYNSLIKKVKRQL